MVVLSNCVNRCSLESYQATYMITFSPCTQKIQCLQTDCLKTKTRQKKKKSHLLNSVSFFYSWQLLPKPVASESGVAHATHWVRNSFKTSRDRVQAQMSAYALQFSKPKSHSHSTTERSKLTHARILNANSISRLKKPQTKPTDKGKWAGGFRLPNHTGA